MFVSLSNTVVEVPQVPCTTTASSLDPPTPRLAQARGTGTVSPLLSQGSRATNTPKYVSGKRRENMFVCFMESLRTRLLFPDGFGESREYKALARLGKRPSL